MKAVAIDLGLKGALAFYDGSAGLAATYWEPMPVSENKVHWVEVYNRMCCHEPKVLIVERMAAFAKSSKNLCMSMGESNGNINMLATVLNARLIWVTPTQWQKNTLLPGAKGTTKPRSIWMARQLYPGIDLTHNGRFKLPHDGAADALCILDWGLRHIGAAT